MIMDFFHFIAFMSTKPYLKSMLNAANVSDSAAGFILASYSLIQFVSAIFLGKWIQKKGHKPQLITAAMFTLVSSVILAFTPLVGKAAGSSETLVCAVIIAFCTLLLGTSHGMFILCGNYIITGLPESEGRDKYVGFFTFTNSIGQFCGPLLASLLLSKALIAKSFSGDYFFVMMLAIVTSTAALIFSCIIKNITVTPAAANAEKAEKKPVKVRDVLADHRLMKIIILNAAYYFSVDVLATYTQAFGERTLLLSASSAALILTVMKFSAIFVRAFLGLLTKIFGSARLLKISLFVLALSVFLMGMTGKISAALAGLGLPLYGTTLTVILIFSLICGFSNGLVNPLSLVHLSSASTPQNRSSALALRGMFNSGGQTVGEVSFGFLAGIFGSLAPVFLVSGGMLFGCFLLSFDKKQKKTTDKTETV